MVHEPLVSVSNLSFRYHKNLVLKKINFSLEEGDLLGVIGPNGSGKTTVLKLLNRMLLMQEGEILINSKPVNHYHPKELARVSGFMASLKDQELQFTCREILEMGRYPHQKGIFALEREDEEQISRAMEYVGMREFSSRSFGNLSSGEKQRLLFALLLVQDPKILLLDEPASHLDIHHRVGLFSMLEELTAEGRGVICTIHDLNLAARFCTRLLLLHRGEVKAFGTPQEVMKSDLLSEIYEVPLEVSQDPFSNTPLVSLGQKNRPKPIFHVHIIGGAASARNLTRELYRMGCKITGGIAHQGDGDMDLWKTLAIPYVSVDAFGEIEDAAFSRALDQISKADLTIITSFPVGKGNERNLELALKAPHLWVEKREDQPPVFTAQAKDWYQQLREDKENLNYGEIIKKIKDLLE